MSKIENPLIDLEGLGTFKEEIEKEISVGNAALSDELNVTKATGGIKSGVTYQADTPLETIFRDMLNPTENPTLTNPIASENQDVVAPNLESAPAFDLNTMYNSNQQILK